MKAMTNNGNDVRGGVVNNNGINNGPHQYVLFLSKSRKSEFLFFLHSNHLIQMTLRRVFKGKFLF